jgi:hypothetical protein
VDGMREEALGFVDGVVLYDCCSGHLFIVLSKLVA